MRKSHFQYLLVSSPKKNYKGPGNGKEYAFNAADLGSIPGSGRSPAEGNGNSLQYILPGEFHEQRSLVGYSPWGPKELDMTERLTLSLSLFWWEFDNGGLSLPFPSLHHLQWNPFPLSTWWILPPNSLLSLLFHPPPLMNSLWLLVQILKKQFLIPWIKFYAAATVYLALHWEFYGELAWEATFAKWKKH